MNIIAHTIVKNEENYLWFSLMSVIDYVDQILVWDTGSTDKALQIIKEVKKRYPNKIKFKEVGEVDLYEFTLMRQEMLDQTKSDWIMILDADEVWWEDSIKKTIKFLKENNKRYDTLVHSYQNPIGDIFHYQDQTAHKYKIDDKIGNVTIRFINRNIEGLNVDKPHGQQGFYDKNGILVQDMNPKRRYHMSGISFLHFTNMPRSAKNFSKLVPKRSKKLKYEIGLNFSKDFFYPEVFFKEKPSFVPSPWKTMSLDYKFRAFFETPLKKLKRRLIKSEVRY